MDDEQGQRIIAENDAPKKQPDKKKGGFFETFTKRAVFVLMANAIAWVWCSYVLAFIGRYEIAQSLSQTAVDTILGTLLGYFAKSAIENVNKHGINYIPRQQDPPDDRGDHDQGGAEQWQNSNRD